MPFSFLKYENSFVRTSNYRDRCAEDLIISYWSPREGSYTMSDNSIVEEINIFSGLENRITFQRVYNKKFKVILRYCIVYTFFMRRPERRLFACKGTRPS